MLPLLWLSLGALKLSGVSADSQYVSPLQHPLAEANAPYVSRAPSRVAIVGAGAAGTSCAYYLAQYARTAGLDVQVTIYERSSYVGGRSTVVNVYDDPQYPVELGASIFVPVNYNLMDAVKTFNLTLNDDDNATKSLGIWDGHTLVWNQDDCESGWCDWWQTARILLKYGFAPVKTRRLVNDYVHRYLNLYNEPNFPFISLTDAISNLGLSDATGQPGSTFLEANGISCFFADDIIQAATRVNYAQNLNGISGMGTMISLAANGAVSVSGGNRQIFQHFASTASTVQLNTSITHVKRNFNGTFSVQYQGVTTINEGIEESLFDQVVIAAPFHQASITLDSEIETPAPVPYVNLHVTLFSTSLKLSPAYFGLPDDTKLPDMLLTTLSENERVGVRPGDTVGTPGLFSLSKVSIVRNPKTGQQEIVYKIFSAEPMTDSKLLLFLSAEGRDSASISWTFRKIWKSYPYLYPRTLFDEPRLAENIWYTAGMENFASTMETNSLMGKNIARLIIDKISNRTYG